MAKRPDDIFTKVEWLIFRLTSVALLALVAYKLLHAEFMKP
jgi:hypothetical protein